MHSQSMTRKHMNCRSEAEKQNKWRKGYNANDG